MGKHPLKYTRKESTVKLHQAVGSIDDAALPYKSSWLNRLIRWVERLPIAPWLFYTGLFTVLTFGIVVSNWIDDATPFGRFDTSLMYTWIGFYPVVFLAAIHRIDRVALQSFDAFRLALGKGDAEAERLRYELTTLPARGAWIAAVAGAVFSVSVFFLLGDYNALAVNIPMTYWMVVLIATLGFIITAEMLYHTFHQLRLVNHIHSVATVIDLLHPAPLYAFSNLSAQTGLIFIIVLWFDLVFNPETFVNLGLILLNVLGLIFFAIACFVVPLWGMHRKLVREKQRLDWEINQRIEESLQLLFQRVDASEFHDADPLNKSISSLMITHDFIGKIPTWPWRPETFTLFFSAVTLPIIVYVIQMFLKSLLGFK